MSPDAADSTPDDTLDEIEIVLGRLLNEARETNRHLAFFHRLVIVGVIAYIVVTILSAVLIAGSA